MESLSITSILCLQDFFDIFSHFGDFLSVEIIFNLSNEQKQTAGLVRGHLSLRTTLWSLCGNLASRDFHLFLHLRKFLSGQRQRFRNDREAEMNVRQWFQSQAADLYDTGIQKLVPWYHKCLNSEGKYVEQWLKTYLFQ